MGENALDVILAERMAFEADRGLLDLERRRIEIVMLADAHDRLGDRLHRLAIELRDAEPAVAQPGGAVLGDRMLAELRADLGEQGLRSVAAQELVELAFAADLHQ